MPNNVTYRVLGAANGLLQLLQGAQQRQEWEKQQRQAAIDAMAPIQGALGQLRGLQSQNYPMAALSPEIQNLLSNPNAPIAPADRARILGELMSVVSGAQANQTINTKGQEMMGSLQAMQAMGIPIPEVDVSSMSPAGILGYVQAVLQQAPAMQKAAAQTAEDAAAKAEAEAKRKQSALTNLEMQVSRLASNPNLDPQARDMIEQLQAKRDQWGMQPVEELERLGASLAGYEIPKTPAAMAKEQFSAQEAIGILSRMSDLTAPEQDFVKMASEALMLPGANVGWIAGQSKNILNAKGWEEGPQGWRQKATPKPTKGQENQAAALSNMTAQWEAIKRNWPMTGDVGAQQYRAEVDALLSDPNADVGAKVGRLYQELNRNALMGSGKGLMPVWVPSGTSYKAVMPYEVEYKEASTAALRSLMGYREDLIRQADERIDIAWAQYRLGQARLKFDEDHPPASADPIAAAVRAAGAAMSDFINKVRSGFQKNRKVTKEELLQVAIPAMGQYANDPEARKSLDALIGQTLNPSTPTGITPPVPLRPQGQVMPDPTGPGQNPGYIQ